ncbi:helix-turn-helix domain-containing protein [Acinetobacter oleivorans]|nr:helix-turn-helix domain-containing protein [Acinetobacter baumannii]MBE2170840.1 helix-turn-helix domain-containing protein [Acinetobacter oleivorans]MCO9051080.1 helix-turn-helix domain-containing protein [Acinetobacter sp. UC24323]URM42548.1 helix-turn-helix domain-containing protein [Acinetobacter sp. AS23]EKW1172960.1 helix-turn-helix domain-containing protein [Acinetobacter baumannii]
MMRDQIIQHPLSEETIKYDDYIAGLAKGLNILEAFGTDRQRLNVTQVAERTNITRTAARRYLKTLKFLGYLETDEYYYWLTHKVLKFSGAFLSTAHLPKISQSVLNHLSEKTTLVFSVVVQDNYEVVPIARSVPQNDHFRVSPFGIHLGNRIPAHASSTGKVLLAHKSLEEQKNWIKLYGLKRFTAYTYTEEASFLAALQTIKDNGYCISAEEYELGVTAIAIPIINQTGDIIAGLNAVAPISKVNDTYLINTVLPLLREAAKEIRDMI